MTDYVTIKRSEIEAAINKFENAIGWSASLQSAATLADEIRAILDKAPSFEPVCNVEGTWLWLKLMDYCRKHRIAPATQNDLFAIAGEAHNLYTSPPQAELYAEIRKLGNEITELKIQKTQLQTELANIRGAA